MKLKYFLLYYGIDKKTDSNVVKKKIIQYITLRYNTVHRWIGTQSDLWKAAQYYQSGFDFAGYAHIVLKLSSK